LKTRRKVRMKKVRTGKRDGPVTRIYPVGRTIANIMSYKLQRHAQMADQVGNIWRDGKREEPLSYVYVGRERERMVVRRTCMVENMDKQILYFEREVWTYLSKVK
jgi:hypothetical protein